MRKRRAAALACIGTEGKLRYHQRLSPDIEQRAVHLTRLILKHAQQGGFFCEQNRLRLGIPLHHAEQDKKSLTRFSNRFALYGDARMRNPL